MSGAFLAAATKSANVLNWDFAFVTITCGSVATSVIGVRSARLTFAFATVIGVASQWVSPERSSPRCLFDRPCTTSRRSSRPPGTLRTGQLVSMILFSYITLIIWRVNTSLPPPTALCVTTSTGPDLPPPPPPEPFRTRRGRPAPEAAMAIGEKLPDSEHDPLPSYGLSGRRLRWLMRRSRSPARAPCGRDRRSAGRTARRPGR